jgi:hypothetical protein
MPNDTLIKVMGGGMGCALIKVDVFKSMEKYYWYKFVEYDNGMALGEDLYFCDRVRGRGYEIYCRTSVACGHINKTTYR